jgi:hypothetical protein
LSGALVSIAWSGDGEMFAVGSFNTLRLCDKVRILMTLFYTGNLKLYIFKGTVPRDRVYCTAN